MTWRMLSRIEPKVPGTGSSSCSGVSDPQASISCRLAQAWWPNASSSEWVVIGRQGTNSHRLHHNSRAVRLRSIGFGSALLVGLASCGGQVRLQLVEPRQPGPRLHRSGGRHPHGRHYSVRGVHQPVTAQLPVRRHARRPGPHLQIHADYKGRARTRWGASSMARASWGCRPACCAGAAGRRCHRDARRSFTVPIPASPARRPPRTVIGSYRGANRVTFGPVLI